MLAGLMSLEAGMSRMKNVGTLVPKALIAMAVAAFAYYAVGFAFAFGNGDIIGSTGSSCATTATRRRRSGSWACRTR